MKLPALMFDEHIYSALIRHRFLAGQMYMNDKQFFELNAITPHWLRSQTPFCSHVHKVIQHFSSEKDVQFNLRLQHTPFSPWLLSLPSGTSYLELTSSGLRKNLEESPFAVNRQWKLCTQCSDDERRTYGFSYWHASHQLPGARICLIHQQPLHTHENLRYLDFSLPHRWARRASPMTLNRWQRDWQPFVYGLFTLLQRQPHLAPALVRQAREMIGAGHELKRRDRLHIDEKFLEMKIDLGIDCLRGLFTSFAPHRVNSTQLLWVTISPFSVTKGIRHPLYWLVILFWLRKKLSLLDVVNLDAHG